MIGGNTFLISDHQLVSFAAVIWSKETNHQPAVGYFTSMAQDSSSGPTGHEPSVQSSRSAMLLLSKCFTFKATSIFHTSPLDIHHLVHFLSATWRKESIVILISACASSKHDVISIISSRGTFTSFIMLK